MSSVIDNNGNLHDPAGRFAGLARSEASVTVLNPTPEPGSDVAIVEDLVDALPEAFRPRSGRADMSAVRQAWRRRSAHLDDQEFSRRWDRLVEAKRGEDWANTVCADARTGGPTCVADLPEWVTGVMPRGDFEITFASDFLTGADDVDYASYLADRWASAYMESVRAFCDPASAPSAPSARIA